jgi:two-component system, NarL family, nitrate/nitrite response regulator NarL
MSIRILIVEDHLSMSWGLSRLIETEQPRMQVVGIADDLASARGQVMALKPDLVLLDLDLGDDDGAQLIPELVAKGIKVLVLTGMRDEAVQDASIVAGARGIVLKEMSHDLILKAIEKVHAGELWLDRDRSGRIFTQLTHARTTAPADPLAGLTAREREIATVLAREKGAPNKVLADHLGISERTLRNHLTAIYGKLGVANRMELFILASELQG